MSALGLLCTRSRPNRGHRVTGLIAQSYAPELKLVGVAAAAPASELATLVNDDLTTPGGKNIAAMTLWSWARVYGASIQDVVVPGGNADDRSSGPGVHRVGFRSGDAPHNREAAGAEFPIGQQSQRR